MFEWLITRPYYNDVLTNLTNYVSVPFTINLAINTVGKKSTYYYPGSSPTGEIYAVTMLDNNKQPISYPQLGGLFDLWMNDEGSAY